MPQSIVVAEHGAGTDLPLVIVPFAPATRAFISFPCAGLEGTLDGVITVYAVNGSAKSIIATVVLDAEDNSDDVHYVSYSGNPESLGYAYEKNGCTSGAFDIVLSRNRQ